MTFVMSALDTSLLEIFATEASDLVDQWESICLSLEKDPGTEKLNELFRIAHNLKGSSRAIGLLPFGDFVHIVEDAITAARDKEIETTSELISVFLKTHSVLHEWVKQMLPNPTYSPDTSFIANEVHRILNTKGHKSESSHSETVSTEKNESVAQVTTEEAFIPPTGQGVQKAPPTTASKTADETIRISTKKLDQLLQMIGELSIHQTIIWHSGMKQVGAEKTATNAAHLSRKLTKEIYEQAMSLRMQPVQQLFQRLERTIRDLSKDLNKQIDVSVRGGEVELDKTVLERIIDPLTHIVRNSADHGIEKPEERTSAGKTAVGTVSIYAQQDPDGVSIIVEDDGKGLNQKRIFEKAVEKGIIASDAKLSSDDMVNLIFMPGFSTAESITNVSGRGVGMDIVKKAVTDLSGTINVKTEPGKGTKFIITLPTSLSIVEALIVGLGESQYAIPISALEEVIDLSDCEKNPSGEMILLRGNVIPLQKLNRYLPHPSLTSEKTNSNKALITRIEKERVAFTIDNIFGQQQIVVRQLRGGLAEAFGFCGGTILGTGEPGMIIDLPLIARTYLERTRKKEVAA